MALALVLIGVGLRLWQYLANSSLWIDEAALARNIIERSPAGLLRPLDYAQVAPLGFLLVEKGMTAMAGPSEWVLRLFPLFCGLGALVLFWRLAFSMLSGWTATYAIGLFAFGAPFVYFSSHVKQYSSDVFCALVILSSAWWLRQAPERLSRGFLVGLVGACTVWFSQPAVIVAAATGLALALCAVLEKRRALILPLLAVGTLWALSGAGTVLFAIRNVSAMDRTYFEWFWHLGFWPWPPTTFSEILWPFKQLTLAFGTFVSGPRRTNGGLNYPWSGFFALVVLVGFVALWRTRRDAAFLLLSPTILALSASASSRYPFTGRVMAYLLPGFLLAAAAGARFLLTTWPRRLHFATPLPLALLGGAPIYAAATALPPEHIEHLRPVLAEVAARREPGDTLFVHNSAGQAFLYYAPRLDLHAGDYVIGHCERGDPRGYLRQLDRFRGNPRVWVVATHLYYPRGAFEWITEYLDTIGRKRESTVVEATTGLSIHGAYAYLYDLSDPQRLGSATADSFAARPTVVSDPQARLACHGVQSPLGTF